jgi:hypothetical protein
VRPRYSLRRRRSIPMVHTNAKGSCAITKTIGLRAKFLRLSALLCMADIGDSHRSPKRAALILPGPWLCAGLHEVLRSGDQGVLANVSARNRATVKFELVASPPGGQTALQGPVRDASKRLPVLRMPEAARLKA